MLSWGIGDFLIQRNVRKIGDVEALFFIGLVGAIGLLPFAWNELPSLFIPSNMILVSVLGIITFIAAILDFEALKQGKLSVIEVILEIELPVTIILGLVFFKEILSIPQLAVIALIFIGIALMALKSHHL